ncbi:hypothetical protein K432DRAFT_383579, partial [Lepidopterella palustris CBS 459.81]
MSDANKNTSVAEEPKTKPTPLRNSFEQKANKLQNKKQTRGPQPLPDYEEEYDNDDDVALDGGQAWPEPQMPARHPGKRRMVPVHQSRIADRPVKDHDSNVKIKIELDLEVEVEIYARVKGDVMIGL